MVEFNLSIFESASDIRSRYNFSFWNGLIVACALEAGANLLSFEDMQNGLLVASQLQIVNPFS